MNIIFWKPQKGTHPKTYIAYSLTPLQGLQECGHIWQTINKKWELLINNPTDSYDDSKTYDDPLEAMLAMENTIELIPFGIRYNDLTITPFWEKDKLLINITKPDKTEIQIPIASFYITTTEEQLNGIPEYTITLNTGETFYSPIKYVGEYQLMKSIFWAVENNPELNNPH